MKKNISYILFLSSFFYFSPLLQAAETNQKTEYSYKKEIVTELSIIDKLLKSVGFGFDKSFWIKVKEKLNEEKVEPKTEMGKILDTAANKDKNDKKKEEEEQTKKTESDEYSKDTPFYNPETGKFQDKPYEGKNNIQDATDVHGLDANHYSVQRWQPYQNYLNPASNPYTNHPTGGHDLSMLALRPEDMKDLPKLGSGNENCGGIGAYGSLSPAVTARVKFDLNRICNAFGKRIKIIDSKRSCGGPSRHCFGEAVDYEVKSYGDRKQQALLVVAFIALGYNLGSYERGFPLHADHEEARYWKTWSRWAHVNGQSALPYELPARDALALIGMPANSAGEFHVRYGHPPKYFMSQKALQFLKSAYGNDAIKFTPATQNQPGV